MMRRPPGDGTVANTFMLALVILFIPWLVEAQRHPQGQGVRQRFDSQNSAVEADASHTLAATRLNQRLETPISSDRRKSTLSVNNNIKYNQNDESAIATVAPADPAVRAPASKPFGIQSAGLPSLQIARNLEDWEVEDFVLLATVDGKLYARDRKNGKERWTLEMDKPMVETRYHNRNRSTLEDEYKPYDEYLWIIEPSRDGVLFVYMPGGSQPGLVNTGLTMKKLVEEMAPFAGEDPPVLYAGDKKTTMITLDARTGRVLKWFGSSGSLINEDSEDPSCPRTTGLVDNDECRTTGTIILGRTEYSVAIQGTDGHAIATLKFSEWVPNNYDNDLQREYRSTMDSKYVHSSHDGSVFAYDHGDQYSEPSRLFREKFSSPVVRVFDVARPWGTQDKNPQLVVLPQPVPPVENPTIAGMQQSEIFLNHTEDGSWYAMSGKNYPLVMKGPEQAMCDRPQWWQHAPLWENLDEAQMHEALVGLHTIDSQRPASRLAISPPLLDKVENDSVILPDVGPAEPEVVSISARIQQIPNLVLGNLLDFVQNPVLIVCCIILAVIYFKDLKKWSRSIVKTKIQPLLEPATSINDVAEISDLTNVPETEAKVVEEKLKVDVIDGSSESSQEPTAKMAEVKTPKTSPNQDGDEPAIQLLDDTSDTPKPTPEKKKAHRGRRGGVKHRKGRNRNDGSTSDDPGPKPPATVEDAVRDAQNLGGQTRMLEPDMQTLPNGVSEVSDPVIRLNNLEVDTEALIGTGSNGTMVFKGKFDGRDVAVKRMLMQFYDIASQETKLLRESDDHPNVIRYYAQQQNSGFLFIALELCPASLADVIDKPQKFPELARSGEQDLPNVLYQITNGLQHLHNLRIVHRDLKPQNILVAMGKDGRPRLMVSDFGLCKKLEGEQSSFRATTAHAAGTTGWRAPELLLDDDVRDGSTTAIDASTHSGSGPLLSSDLLPTRRATRAIDIFSLGLVFYYVLTKGSHPYDHGDRYMREVNIRKGHYSLRLLDVLGDYAFEAKDLIGSMLNLEPKLRPPARSVLAHPFFWSPKKRLNFLCDVSDHFEKEKREPPSPALQSLEMWAEEVCRGDFLKHLGKDFVESMGKQRKYTGTRLLDLLRALRNKKNHYEDMPDKLKEAVGPLPEGYLSFWSRRFPNLLITCWNVVYDVQWEDTYRFREYYLPAGI